MDGQNKRTAQLVARSRLWSRNRFVVESQFSLTGGAEVFAAEIQAINKAIKVAHRRDLSELGIYSDSRSTLQALYILVSQHKAVAENKDLIKQLLSMFISIGSKQD